MEKLSDKKNYDFVDLCKFIGSFLVVSIHTEIFSSLSTDFNYYFINLFSRLAVYFFFISSAYFFFRGIEFSNGKIAKSKENTIKLKKYIFRISILYIIWSVVYFLWYMYQGVTEGWFSIGEVAFFGINTVLKSSYYHLWFLISLIYAIPIIYLVLRFIRVKTLLVASAILYFIGLLYGSYAFVEMPFSDLWNIINDKWPRILSVVFDVIPICSFAIVSDKKNLPKVKLCLITAILFVLYSTEGMILYYILPDKASSYIIFTIPTVFFIFIVTKCVSIKLSSTYIIRKISTLIYCMHPLVMGLFNLFVDKSGLNSILYFIVISAITFIISLAIVLLYKKTKRLNFLKYIM